MPLLCLKTRSDLIYLRKSYRQLFIKKKKINNENIYFEITSYKKHNIIINIPSNELVSKIIFTQKKKINRTILILMTSLTVWTIINSSLNLIKIIYYDYINVYYYNIWNIWNINFYKKEVTKSMILIFLLRSKKICIIDFNCSNVEYIKYFIHFINFSLIESIFLIKYSK